jgi:hypothetical protein
MTRDQIKRTMEQAGLVADGGICAGSPIVATVGVARKLNRINDLFTLTNYNRGRSWVERGA